MLPKMQTILYSTDFGEKSVQAFRMAASMGQQYGARIVLLHVMEQVSEGVQHMISGMLPKNELTKLHHEARESVLKSLNEQWDALAAAELSDAGERHELRVEQGEPAHTILKVADEIDADLLVIGTHSHSHVGEWLLGSVAYRLMHTTRRPVLLVPLV